MMKGRQLSGIGRRGRDRGCNGHTSRTGFTLVEIVVALGIFATSVVVLMAVYVSIATLRESNRNTTQAMADARSVLEAMRDRSVSGLASVTAVDWMEWAQDNGLTSLQDEEITVTYADEEDDPLEISIQVNWTERGRTRSAVLNTLMTQR